MTTDIDIVKDWNTKYQYSWEAMNPFFSQSEKNVRMYLGDQWEKIEREALLEQGRSAVVVNEMLPAIKMISGYQRKHRLSSVAVPVEQTDQAESDQLTQLLLYFFTTSGAYETISEAFEGAMYSALNMVCPYVDYSRSPEGEMMISREPYNAFMLDPFFTRKDLSDCGYLGRRKYIDKNTADLMLPKHVKEIKNFISQGAYRDDKFVWLPYQQIATSQPMIAFDEFWEQKSEKIKVILDTQTGQEYPFNNESELFGAPDHFQVIQRLQPYVLRHIIMNGEFIETQKNPDGLAEYPFVPFFCLWYPEQAAWSLKCQSLVNVAQDAQIEANKRRSQMTDFYESQLNTGWIAEEGSVVDPRSLFQTGQGKVIWKKKGSDPNGLQRIDPPQLPQGLELLRQNSTNDIRAQMGVTEELLGQQDTEDDSGLKVALRQSAALVGLQPYFDNLRYAQKLVSQKMIKLIPAIAQTKIARILGKEPSPKLFDQRNLKCDINVEEGLLTTTQKEMFFRQVVALQQLGVQTPPNVLIRNAPIQGKLEYYEEMEKFNQQQQQQAQEQQKVQNSLLESEQKLAQAQSLYDIARAKASMADAEKTRVEEDDVAAKTVNDRADAVLRQVETLKRLEDLDDARLDRIIGLMERMDALAQAQEDKQKAQAEQKTQESESELMQSAQPQQQQPEPVQQMNEQGAGV